MNLLRFFLVFIVVFVIFAFLNWDRWTMLAGGSDMDPERLYGDICFIFMLSSLLVIPRWRMNYEFEVNEKNNFIENLDKYFNENFNLRKKELTEGIYYKSRLGFTNSFKVKFINGKALLSGPYYRILEIRKEVLGEEKAKSMIRNEWIKGISIAGVLIFILIGLPMTNAYKRYFCNLESYRSCSELGERLFKSGKKQEGLNYLNKACDNYYYKACAKIGDLALEEGNEEEWEKQHEKVCKKLKSSSCLKLATWYDKKGDLKMAAHYYKLDYHAGGWRGIKTLEKRCNGLAENADLYACMAACDLNLYHHDTASARRCYKKLCELGVKEGCDKLKSLKS